MKRSTIINIALFLTIAAIGTAVVLKMLYAPPKAAGGGGGMGGDSFILISPVFFVIAAKKATRFGGAAVVLALIGLAFAGLGLYGAVEMAQKPTPKQGSPRAP